VFHAEVVFLLVEFPENQMIGRREGGVIVANGHAVAVLLFFLGFPLLLLQLEEDISGIRIPVPEVGTHAGKGSRRF
jgi:hypothetical protein